MKAVVYTQYGPPDVLHVTTVTAPVPKDDEVLVRVRATTVSAADVRCRRFAVPLSFWIPARLALGIRRPRRPILGFELAGDVEAVGKNVTRFKTGDRIFAETGHRQGGYAEYVCLAEAGVIATMPANMTYEDAAAVPIGALTALHYLRRGKVERGQRVLIYGASGSVGTFAVQLATHLGAHVTGVCGPAHVDLVRSLGADVVVDYTAGDFAAARERYDVVFVAVDKADFRSCLKVLKKGGTYLNATTPLRTLHMWWTALTSDTTIVGGELPPKSPDDLLFLRDLIEHGQLRAVVDRRYSMDQTVDAHRYVDLGHKAGNVVITVP